MTSKPVEAVPSPQTPFTLHGKTALVTGAGSGINLAFAELLLEAGSNVVFADLALRPEAQRLVDRYSDKTDGKPRAVFVRTDVTIWKELDRMFKVADDEFGGADIVCPGAGVYEPPWSNFWHPPGTSTSKDAPSGEEGSGLGHYKLLDLNLTHPIRVTQMAIARWLNPPTGSRVGKVSPQNPKRVVHISSIAGQLSSLPVPLYHASKWGISGFVRSLAALDVLGIRVNGVAPGLILTPLWLEHEEKTRYVDIESKSWVTAVETAEGMVACLVDDAFRAGDIVEITKGARRVVSAINDPGPDSNALVGYDKKDAYATVFKTIAEPGWGISEKKNQTTEV